MSPPTDEEIAVVLARIMTRVQHLLERRGFDPGDADGLQADPVGEESPALPLEMGWAALMRRAFDLDVLACPRCGGRLRLIATVEDPDAIRAILGALTDGRPSWAGSAVAAAQAPTTR